MSTSAPCARSTDTDAFDDAWGDLIHEVLRPIMAAAVVALWGAHLALLFSSSSNESLIRALVLTRFLRQWTSTCLVATSR